LLRESSRELGTARGKPYPLSVDYTVDQGYQGSKKTSISIALWGIFHGEEGRRNRGGNFFVPLFGGCGEKKGRTKNWVVKKKKPSTYSLPVKGKGGIGSHPAFQCKKGGERAESPRRVGRRGKEHAPFPMLMRSERRRRGGGSRRKH